MNEPPGLDPLEERILRRIPMEILGCALLFGLAGLVLFGPATGLFIVLGGAFSCLTFLWLRRSLSGVLDRTKRKALGRGLALYGLRILLILAVFSSIILIYPERLLAFAVGFSAIIAVFLVEAVGALSRLRQWKD